MRAKLALYAFLGINSHESTKEVVLYNMKMGVLIQGILTMICVQPFMNGILYIRT